MRRRAQRRCACERVARVRRARLRVVHVRVLSRRVHALRRVHLRPHARAQQARRPLLPREISRACGRAVSQGGAPWWRHRPPATCHTAPRRQCLGLVSAHERAREKRYRYILKLRPDLRIDAPFPPISALESRIPFAPPTICTSFGGGGASVRFEYAGVTLADKWALMRRDVADVYMNATRAFDGQARHRTPLGGPLFSEERQNRVDPGSAVSARGLPPPPLGAAVCKMMPSRAPFHARSPPPRAVHRATRRRRGVRRQKGRESAQAGAQRAAAGATAEAQPVLGDTAVRAGAAHGDGL